MGNVWRFPYLVYRNGGGAFLIPYIIFLALVGLPVFFLELAFGQFASLGPLTIWRVNPLFKGVGYASIIMSALVAVYYNVVIAYALYYLFVSLVSFDGEVPWATCGNPWNTHLCRTNVAAITDDMNETLKLNLTLANMDYTCVNNTLYNIGLTDVDLTYNLTQTSNFTTCKNELKLPSDEYFSNYVLRLNEAQDFGHLGGITPKIALALLLAWLIVFFSLKQGVKSSGKVIYFIATFPYLVLVILLVRGVTLDGYMKGIKFYIIPKWATLLKPQVWIDAASQIFYSLGPAFGNSILVAIINCGTSIFAGFVIFSVMGYMATVTNQDVEDVTQQGPGLLFVAYPEGIARMPFPPIWAVLFFPNDCVTRLLKPAIISALADEFPHTLRRHKAWLTFFVCISLFGVGMALMTYGGIWVLTLMNDYSASYTLLFTCLMELVAINWVYGVKNFSKDIELMLGFRPNIYWVANWTVIAPILIVAILIFSGIKFAPSSYGSYQFPDWGQGIGFGMVALPLVFFFGAMLIQLCRYGGFKNAIKPLEVLGPSDTGGRETWSRKLDFILSTIGYAVGLGNLWRFPFLAFRNGGGAFLVPYVIMLTLIGLPIFYMELAIGQFASYGPTGIWKMNPLFKALFSTDFVTLNEKSNQTLQKYAHNDDVTIVIKVTFCVLGVGIAAVMISFMVSIYYNVIIAYGFFFLAVSFIYLDQNLPWANCKNSWNTKFCVDSVRPDINTMNETTKIQTVLSKYNKRTCPCPKNKVNRIYCFAYSFFFSLICKINTKSSAIIHCDDLFGLFCVFIFIFQNVDLNNMLFYIN
ncbi:hypothetical protein KUTeg_024030 [Tegillarca granosa]|uniref:Transporter n=1 Tax=Tegillarca granosa TaxID=220873 RepID=A0ABQ9DW62_TEGGR|nr:hypothetical protein KUTeg_024030 [Tegillarca granosa]